MPSLGSISGQVRLNTRQAVAAYAALRAQNARTVYAMRGTGDAFVASGKRMTYAGGAMLAVFGKAVQAAAEFERKMDFFAAVTDTNTAKMRKLSKFTLQVAQDTIYSADQIAEGFIELGKSGVGAEKIMHGVGRAMANLGAAGDIPLTQSAQIMTSALQQFDLKASKATHVADLLAGAANASIADIEDVGVSLKYVGGVANAAGLTFDDTTTAISLLAKAGIRGSTAGTSLRQMIVSLPGATKPADNALRDLGIITGKGTEEVNKFYDANGNLKPLAQVYQILQDATDGLNAKTRLMYLRTIFNNRALSAAAILTREGSKGFKDMNKEMSKVTAADVAHKRLDNLSGDIEILRGNIETLLVTQGGPFQKTAREWVKRLTKLVQAFSKLDPAMQKNIFQFLGWGGAALVAMGSLTMFVGMIFHFLVAMSRMRAAVGFVLRVLGLYAPAAEAGGVATGLLAGPIGWVVLAIIALVAAFVIAYKKSEKFRALVQKIGQSFMNDFVKPIWNAIKSVIKFFKDFDAHPKKTWQKLKDGVKNAVNAVIAWFKRLGSKIKTSFNNAVTSVKNFIGGVITWFRKLPGKVWGIITRFVSRVAKLFTFHNVGYALGFLLGTMIRIWWKIYSTVLRIVATIIQKVWDAFKGLPAKIWNALVAAYQFVTRAMTKLREIMLNLAIKAIMATLSWFRKLPERIKAFMQKATVWVGTKMLEMVQWAKTNGPKIFHAIIDWFKKLPGRIRDFLVKAVAWVATNIPKMVAKAKELGRKFINGALQFIRTLPRRIGDILGKIIGAIGDKIKSVKKHMTDFGKGMWEGFKDGIGMHSPSHFERAMWQITGTVGDETKKLARNTMHVQRLSEKMAKTQFGVDGNPRNKMTTMGTLVRNKQVADAVAVKAGTQVMNTSHTAKSVTNNNKFEVHNPRPERASQSVTKVLKNKVREAGYND